MGGAIGIWVLVYDLTLNESATFVHIADSLCLIRGRAERQVIVSGPALVQLASARLLSFPGPAAWHSAPSTIKGTIVSNGVFCNAVRLRAGRPVGTMTAFIVSWHHQAAASRSFRGCSLQNRMRVPKEAKDSNSPLSDHLQARAECTPRDSRVQRLRPGLHHLALTRLQNSRCFENVQGSTGLYRYHGHCLSTETYTRHTCLSQRTGSRIISINGRKELLTLCEVFRVKCQIFRKSQQLRQLGRFLRRARSLARQVPGATASRHVERPCPTRI